MGDLLFDMGKRILQRRKQLRMTQEELADKAGVTPQTISAAELGKKALRPANILGISDALEVSTEYLLRGIVTPEDNAILTQKVSVLSPMQYRHLEDIVDSYVAAVTLSDKEA